MNSKAQIIKNRLSLRKPQSDSLEILEKLADELELKVGADAAEAIQKVNSHYPTCTDFERDFPSVCFALATGVGKTRLMGAFISYLYSAKGIKNYFVLAPNLTIYNKLIEDLSNPNSPKYVFRGISEFSVMPPRIITGDNYAEARQASIFKTSVNINIFNISKINSEVRGGREPRIKRLSEYLGESYFNYLAELPDLVLIMDESHHYRAAAGMSAINQLKPILGLELTATPIDPHGDKFKNVVFDYPLAKALQDGFVKEPAVATRRNFNPDQYRHDPIELDQIKLEDGIRLHEDTKVKLEIYSRDTENRLVRPFVLVVARDTDHAKVIRKLIESPQFFDGRYAGKVMEINSNQRGEEKEENINLLLSLEKPENKIEIVIHVYMLKEGWDVTNLYTIIPLSAARSQILTEQTIGRGLRLPYGVRTGFKEVDRLTIIAHDRFQAIVDAANDPTSIIRQENIIEIDPEALEVNQEVVSVGSVVDDDLDQRREAIAATTDEGKREKLTVALEARQAIIDAVGTLSSEVKNIDDLPAPQVQKVVIARMKKRMEDARQPSLFTQQVIDAANRDYAAVVSELMEKIIPIPRMLIQQKNDVKSGFHNFELDVDGLNYQPVSEEILLQTLRTNEIDIIQQEDSGIEREEPENIIVNQLINYPEVDYDREKELLYKLVRQALSKLGKGCKADEIKNIVLYYKRDIGRYIYSQLQLNFYVEKADFEEPKIYPFTQIEKHNYSKTRDEDIYRYTETITPTNTIPSKLFGGFVKACHTRYKFDSKAEKDFATVLESDREVVRWLRPAQAQFSLWWRFNSKQYWPDFVVETEKTIYMVEIKAEGEIDDSEVREKAEAGMKYSEAASKYNASHGGKAWKYVLISHVDVRPNMSLSGLVSMNKA